METNLNQHEQTTDYEATKSKVLGATSKIKEGVQELAGETKHVAILGQEIATKSMHDGLEVINKKSSQLMCALEDSVKNKPIQSMALAAGVGFVLAALMRRSS